VRLTPGRDAVIAAALAACLVLPGPAAAEPITVRGRPIVLDSEEPGRTRVGELEFVAGFSLHSGDRRFGGLSGLTLGRDGRSLIAVSDHGWWLTARLRQEADGSLAGLEAAALDPLRRADGKPVRIADGEHDAEAVERLADGSLVVSFERRHRLWRYASPGVAAAPYVAFAELARLPRNGGIEAIAPLADGRLLLLAEESNDAAGDHRGWLWQDGRATALSYAAVGAFKPTDMAPLPDGDVLVLERRFSPIGGAGARLVRIERDAVRPGARLDGREVARLEWPVVTENFEALAVASAPGGGSFVYLLSDDNFNPLQNTLLLQFRLAR